MASSNNIPQYPYMFSPDQFSNQFSLYNNQPLPWPSQYAGTPTDALGNPILPPSQTPAAPPAMAPSTTLNSNPGQWAINNTMANQMGLRASQGGGNLQGMSDAINLRAANNAAYGVKQPYGGPVLQSSGLNAGQPTQASAAPASSGPDMSQAYLRALANPGPVTTPGATVAQVAPPSGQSSVLQQFLQNWQNRGSPTQGAGNYNNAGFFNALQGRV